MKRIFFTIIAFVTLIAFTAPAIYADDEPAPTPTEPSSPPPDDPAPTPPPDDPAPSPPPDDPAASPTPGY